MAGLLDLLNSDMGKTIISGVSSQTGQTTEKTQNLLSMALPVLTQAIQRKAETPQGAAGLLSSLGGNDGGILDNLSGFFDGGVDESVTNEGAGILSNILGDKQESVQNALSQKSGIDASSVGSILKMAAPLLMGVLGKQSTEQNVSDTNGLSGLLGGLIGSGSSASQSQGFLSSILDADGDGSVIDDVAGMVMGKKKGGLGGIIGGLFGKK